MRVLRLLIAGLLALPSVASARWYDPTPGTWLSRDTVGAENYLKEPNSIGPWSYANLNPGRYTDPHGRCTNADRRYSAELGRLGFKTATTELCIAADYRDEMDRLLGLYQYARSPERLSELSTRLAELEGKASALEGSYEIDIDRRRSVFDPLAATVAVGVVASPALVAASGTAVGAFLLKGATTIGVGVSAAKLTTTATGTKLDGTLYGECAGSWYECDRVWDGVQSSSELVLGFYGAAALLEAEGAPLFSSPPNSIYRSGGSGRVPLTRRDQHPVMTGQESSNNCGPACVVELLRREGVNVSQAEVRTAAGVLGDDPLQPSDVAAALNALGRQHKWRSGAVTADAVDRLREREWIALGSGKAFDTKNPVGHYGIVEPTASSFVMSDPAGVTAPLPGPAALGPVAPRTFFRWWGNQGNQAVFPFAPKE